MRQFAMKGFRISQLGREAKVLYTFFCVLALAALVVTTLYYYDLVGAHLSGVSEKYHGHIQTDAEAPPTGGGPQIELPPDAPAPEKIVVGMSYGKLLEVTHFHLFTVPVFLLIIAHLFLLTPVRAGTKLVWISGASLGATAHIAGPWIVHYGGTAWSWVMPVTGIWMVATMTVLTLYPVWAMWAGEPARTAEVAS